MIRIGVRELRQHASRYLERVKAGDIVEVTERGKLIALLVSPSPAVVTRDRLIASGRLRPAKSPFQLPSSRAAFDIADTASQVLAELREDRFM